MKKKEEENKEEEKKEEETKCIHTYNGKQFLFTLARLILDRT